MEMIENNGIKNKSEFTNKEIIDALCLLINKKIWIAFFFFGLASLLLYVVEVLNSNDATTAWLFSGVFLVLISIFMYFGLPSIIKKSNNNFKDGVIYEYEFFENEFVIKTKLTGQNSIMTIEYSSLFRTVKLEKYLGIYISKGQCFILKLDNFENEEDKNEVLRLLKSKR